MTNNNRISVIVPVYNVKDYLERCFNSIIHQTYQNLEIILIDDGSTDGSGELCDELSKRDGRVRVVHKQNGGLGSARNAGMEKATGDVFSFIDSDDWIEKEMYQCMMQLMCHDQSQIVACGIKRVTEEGKISFYNDSFNEIICYTTEEALRELPKNVRISNSMCNKLFSRETIENLRINETIYFEDNPFTPQCIARAERVSYIAEPFYCYFERAGSISREVFSVKEFDRVIADKMRLDFYHDYFPQCEDAAAIAYIGTCLKVYAQSRGNLRVKEQRKQLKKELHKTIRSYPELPYTRKQRAKAALFVISPQLYSVTMKMRGK